MVALAVFELGEAQTVLGELIEVGGLDLSAVTSDVRVAHVIHHDENEVGPGTVGSVSDEVPSMRPAKSDKMEKGFMFSGVERVFSCDVRENQRVAIACPFSWASSEAFPIWPHLLLTPERRSC